MAPESQQVDAPSQAGTAKARTVLAVTTVVITVVGFATLATVVVVQDSSNAMTVFNILVPVFASWVGTVLAFYFGRDNFEAANREVRELVTTVTEAAGEQHAQEQATAIMRPLEDMVVEQLASGNDLSSITLQAIRAKFTEAITRMPILAATAQALYMIHQSSIDRYLATEGHGEGDTLQLFIDSQAAAGFRFDNQHGFGTVAETATAGEVKASMDAAQGVQDIFVTTDGTGDGAVLGWISNLRLSRSLAP